jgi:peptidyl-prolyl cis-trans isomerase D
MRNFKIIGNKAVLYQILEQNLLSKDKLSKHTNLINENIVQLKQAEISQNLITKLKNRYEIEQYYKGN